MRKCLIALLFLAAPAFAQTTVNGRVQTGLSSAKPATCNPGDQFNATDNFSIYMCGPANTWTQAGGAGNPASPSGSLQGNNAGNFGSVAGSSITFGTGAILLTAGADTTTPLAIASHSNTQSAPLLDVNNQSSGTPDTPFVVRGLGTGSFSPAAHKALVHIIQENVATAIGAIEITNHAADVAKGVNNFALLGFNVNDSGLGAISGGGVVGDAANNYWCLSGDANESLFASICNPSGGAAIVPFYVKGATSQTAHLFDLRNSLGATLAGFDSTGLYIGPAGNGAQIICSGQIALSTGAINSGTRATNTLSCSGLNASTDTFNCSFSGDTNAVTGYAPSASGGLTIKVWVSANTGNADQVNDTGSSITPGPATLNCKGLR